VNAEKGRGGMSEASKKFGITPLTVATWVRKFGVAGGTGVKAAKAARVSVKVVAKLQIQVAKAEATLAKVKALLASI
jgi:transposase-like protein